MKTIHVVLLILLVVALGLSLYSILFSVRHVESPLATECPSEIKPTSTPTEQKKPKEKIVSAPTVSPIPGVGAVLPPKEAGPKKAEFAEAMIAFLDDARAMARLITVAHEKRVSNEKWEAIADRFGRIPDPPIKSKELQTVYVKAKEIFGTLKFINALLDIRREREQLWKEGAAGIEDMKNIDNEIEKASQGVQAKIEEVRHVLTVAP